jgi:hypothetical protein
MAGRQLLGLYDDAAAAAEGVTHLHAAGVAATDLDILTDTPYPEGAFGEPPVRHRLYLFPLIGAACGLAVAFLLTVGTQLAYPLPTGGKPLLSLPPMLIIAYEGAMLGAILMTIVGILIESRLPRGSLGLYDPRISQGYIGVLVSGEAALLDEARRLFEQTGAVDVIGAPKTAVEAAR